MRPLGSPPARPRTPAAGPPRPQRRAALIALTLLALLTLTGCDTADLPRFAFPTPATEEAPRILLLWQGSWLAALITGAAVWALIAWTCIFHRRKSETEIPIQTRYNLPIEVLYTVIPFVIIAVLFYFTERDQSILLDESREEDMTVEVIGRQWSWSFNYREDKVYETGTPANRPELWLPVDKLIRFELSSPDVIHSFWVPNFLFKLDVIPGRVNSFELTPNKIGTFTGKCAELCGTDHSRMFFNVRVVSAADYAKHVADLRAAGQSGALPRGILDTAADRERGYNLDEDYEDAGFTPGTGAVSHGGGHSEGTTEEGGEE
ncbi:MAG: aa3-type cytochrome oxidase subunit II [Sporichthyaceae bacterium]